MFTYCTKILNLSEHEAYLRIEVARASRQHPVLLEMLADGRLHLSGIVLLRRHLTAANRETLLKRAAFKTKRQIEELVAELSPKPDVPATMRKLPQRRGKAKQKRIELVPDRVPKPNSEPAQKDSDVEGEVAIPPAPAPAGPAVVKPIAPARYKVAFTASSEFCEKLERLRSLMRSSVPDGDIGAIIEEAVTEKLEQLEAKRFAKTKAPRKSLEETDTSSSSRNIPAAVRRAVCARDHNQCSFVDTSGRRCTEKGGLEFHHRKPFGRGGDHSVENVCLLCKTHYAYLAERDYGKEVMARYRKYRRPSSRVYEPSTAYHIGDRAVRAP